MLNRTTLLVIALFPIVPAFADGYYVAADLGMASYSDKIRDRAAQGSSGIPPAEFSLDRQPFESDETAWGISAGWQLRDWLALELGYADLGNAGQEPFPSLSFFAPNPPVIVPNPPVIPPGPIAGFVPGPVLPVGAALDVEEWSLAARFSKPLVDKLSANWLIGLSRTDYSAEGSFTFNDVVSLNPLVFNPVEIPFASPDAETGLLWGLGFGWQTSASTSLELNYRQHKTDVIDIDTTSLRFLFAF